MNPIYIDASNPEDWDRAIKALEASADEPDDEWDYMVRERRRSAPLKWRERYKEVP